MADADVDTANAPLAEGTAGGDPKPPTTKKAAGGVKKSASARKVAVSAAEHPKYSVMVADAIASLKERGGSSRQAILKYISDKYNLGPEKAKINARLKIALKAGVQTGQLKQSKGTGASGSFRIGEKKRAAEKAALSKAKKPKAAAKKSKSTKRTASAAKKYVKSTAKKVSAKKIGKAAKSPSKKTAAKKPKVASKPKPKKPKSPAKKAAAKPKKLKTAKK